MKGEACSSPFSLIQIVPNTTNRPIDIASGILSVHQAEILYFA